jgi:hypothetical protein
MQRAPFYGRGENRHEESSCNCALAAVAALTASPVFAAVKHRADRPAVERSNRSNLYQSDAQGNQPYPNPDRELYVPELPY